MGRIERSCGDLWCMGRCVICRVVRAENQRIGRVGMVMLAVAAVIAAGLVWWMA